MTPAERARRALPCLTWDEGPSCEGRFGEDPDTDLVDRQWRWCENCRSRDAVERELAEAIAARDLEWAATFEDRRMQFSAEAVEGERERVLRLLVAWSRGALSAKTLTELCAAIESGGEELRT